MLVFRLCGLLLPPLLASADADIEGKWRTGRARLMMEFVTNADDDADAGAVVSATSARVRHVDLLEAVE
jgi:hypothetical protein